MYIHCHAAGGVAPNPVTVGISYIIYLFFVDEGKPSFLTFMESTGFPVFRQDPLDIGEGYIQPFKPGIVFVVQYFLGYISCIFYLSMVHEGICQSKDVAKESLNIPTFLRP